MKILPRGLGSWNLGRTQAEPTVPAPYYLIANDAAGGYFALNGGGLDGTPGNVFYLPPDTLEWEDCEKGYGDFLHWALVGDLQMYYENLHWQNWREEIRNLSGDSVLYVLSIFMYRRRWRHQPSQPQAYPHCRTLCFHFRFTKIYPVRNAFSGDFFIKAKFGGKYNLRYIKPFTHDHHEKIILLPILLISLATHAEFSEIQDPDGYSNLREKTERPKAES